MAENKESLSRRKFLLQVGGAAAGVALASSGIGLFTPKVEAHGLPPYPWTEYFTKPLDVEVVREKGVRYYTEGNHCSEGAFRAIIEELGSPFSDVPSQILYFGQGGGAGWATLCGAVNGAAAAISLVYGRSSMTPALVNELFGWYSETPLPIGAEVQSVAKNPLCHTSVTLWCEASGLRADSKERSVRCGLITGDTAAQAAIYLNQALKGEFVPVYKIPDEAQSCLSCHGLKGSISDTRGKMNCVDCHDDAH